MNWFATGIKEKNNKITGGDKMRRTIFCFIIIFIILSFGCASTAPKQVFLEGAGDITIGFKDYSRIGLSDGYYILIEKKSDDDWVIKEISKKPITLNVKGFTKKVSNEVLYINETLDFVQPYYASHVLVQFILGGNPQFECIGMNHYYSYSPCNSNLTVIAGPAKEGLNHAKIAKIIKQINLIEKVKEYKEATEDCRNKQLIVNDFINKIRVEPQIVDKSGFYKGEKVVNVSKYIAGNLTCPVDLNDVKYSVSVGTCDNYHFTTNIEPKHYELKYNSESYFLKPTVTVVARTFENIFPKYINEDNSLRVECDGSSILFINKTDKFLQIKTISVYYNAEISNFNFGDKSLELAPQAITKEPLLIKSYITPDIKKMSEYRNITKDSALQQNISFGFAVKYRLVEQNIDRTLYKQNKYNLYNVLSSL
jgi:hypothetical protein